MGSPLSGEKRNREPWEGKELVDITGYVPCTTSRAIGSPDRGPSAYQTLLAEQRKKQKQQQEEECKPYSHTNVMKRAKTLADAVADNAIAYADDRESEHGIPCHVLFAQHVSAQLLSIKVDWMPRMDYGDELDTIGKAINTLASAVGNVKVPASKFDSEDACKISDGAQRLANAMGAIATTLKGRE
jgi:hypothetical protein